MDKKRVAAAAAAPSATSTSGGARNRIGGKVSAGGIGSSSSSSSTSSSKSSGKHQIAGLYDLEETIGEGHYAVVKLAQHVFTGEKVAVKVIDKMKLDAATRIQMLQEVQLMKLVQHPHVVRKIFHTIMVHDAWPSVNECAFHLSIAARSIPSLLDSLVEFFTAPTFEGRA